MEGTGMSEEYSLPTQAPAASSWAEQVQQEQQYSNTQTRKTKAQRSELSPAALNALALTTLLLIAALTHGPVFGGWQGYVASMGGVLVGVALALLARSLKFGVASSALLVFAGYMLFGGPLAIPQTTIAYVLPSLTTAQMLVVGVVSSWKDLLTVQPPTGIFIGPAIMPYLTALVTSFVAITLATRTKRAVWALLPLAGLLVTGILWGSQTAPLSNVLGIIVAIGALIWASMAKTQRTIREAHGSVSFANHSSNGLVKRWIATAIMLALGAGSAFALTTFGLGDAHRTVLRDYVEPPLNLKEYHSPASHFREWSSTEKDTKMLTVKGMKPGERLRLATLDSYDGTVFQIDGNQGNAGFRHVGEIFDDQPLAPGTKTTKLQIEVVEYAGNWVPGVGQTRTLEYFGDRADELGNELYFSDRHITGLSTEKLRKGDTLEVENLVSPTWTDDDLKRAKISSLPIPEDQNVPQVIAEKSAVLTAQAEDGLGKVRAIEQGLQTEGFYSDGSDGNSLAGHRSDRLEAFINGTRLIGNDDQYAPAMVLMLRAQKIPARLVMGFYSEEQNPAQTTFSGKDVHLWVEVPFEGYGWVPFDPTPPKDKLPESEVQKPKPNPTPQVLQPPEPPEEPAEAPLDVLDEPDENEKDNDGFWPTIVFLAKIAGGTFLVLLPWLLLLLLKLRRRNRRRSTGRNDQRAAGAWDEIVDRATDYGVPVAPDLTRRDQARRMEAYLAGEEMPEATGFHSYTEERSHLEEFAMQLDSAVFGEDMPDQETCHTVWNSSKEVIYTIKMRVPWYQRLRSAFSTRSLRARRVPLKVRLKKRFERKQETADVLTEFEKLTQQPR